MKEFIIDKNVDVNPLDAEHPKYFFDDLRKSKKIRIVSGGTNYKKEIISKKALRTLFAELLSAGKIRSVSNESVDRHETDLMSRIIEVMKSCPQECDDPHIVALAHVSGCLNIVTKDKRMSAWRDKVRKQIGHDYCPELRLIMTEAAYKDTL
ncbi:hypothetical protein QWZ10_07470 [Paracoccus cavernae]|uniref:PIN domain-containing protein n=1 Tax=Paracoccus cavernae TaxID=1571207 RepID=A0ABT8D5R3_9RHOB|nr:hypothetical protein [Paracoccus cavernae]